MIRLIARIRTGFNLFKNRLGFGISLALLNVLLVTGCGSNQNDIGPGNSPQSSPSVQAQTKVVNKEGNYITATPNPVSLGGGLTGKTTISWSTKDIPAMEVHVYVYGADGKEQGMFSTGSMGSQEAPWISQPTEFRLVSGSGRPDRKTLDTVTVTLAK